MNVTLRSICVVLVAAYALLSYAAAGDATAQSPFYEKYMKPGDTPIGSISLNWHAMAIADVLFILSSKEYLDFNYKLDPQVKGTITLHMESRRIDKRELWAVLEVLLRTCDAYCAPDDNQGNPIIKVVPFCAMPKEPPTGEWNATISNVHYADIPVRNGPPKEIFEVIKPFFTNGATAILLAGENRIRFVETPSNVLKLRHLIDKLDRVRDESKDQSVDDALKSQPPFYEKYLKPDDESIPVQLKWDALPLTDVLSILSSKGFLDFNYLLDSRVKGTATLSVDKLMSRRELWQLFEQTLMTCGACCVPENQFIKIIPFWVTNKEPRADIQNASTSNIYLTFIPLRHISVNDLTMKIKSSLTAGATLMPLRKEILLVETPSNAARLLPMIKSLDSVPVDGKKAEQDYLLAGDVLKNDGVLLICDNSSYYAFKADGSFHSFPNSVGGRCFIGTWKQSGSNPLKLEVTAQKSWMNGAQPQAQPQDDYRRIVFFVYRGIKYPVNKSYPYAVDYKEVFGCYFFIDELTKISKPDK